MQLKLPIQNEDSDLDDSPKKSKNNTCCDSMTATFPLCLDYQVLACYIVILCMLFALLYEEIEQQQKNTHQKQQICWSILNYSRLNMYRTYIDDVIVIVSIYT